MKKKNLNTFWAELIVEELIRCDVNYFCICGGSRSTPLVSAVAGNKKAKSLICCDERSSAFHAIGFAKAANKPAVVITTSGTAVANVYPALVEASMDKVPMIVLTADRPAELIDTGANQTIRQEHIFDQYVRWQFEMPCPCDDIGPEMVLTTIDQAVYKSMYANGGPVHINCMYREPLEPQKTVLKDSYIKNITGWRKSKKPFSTYQTPIVSARADTLKSLSKIINNTKRGIIVIGKLTSNDERTAILKLIRKLKWTVYADITSGLRLTDCSTHIIRYFDQELLSPAFNKRVKPDVVLHFGGRTTSKRVGQFFDRNRPIQYIVIKNNPDRYDPIHGVTTHIEADITQICGGLLKEIRQRNVNKYSQFFNQKAQRADKIITENIIKDKSLSEVFAAREISNMLPDNTALFLSNSMPVRDVDLYSGNGKKNVFVGANRGASGIDGIISAATGFAVGKKSMATLLIGDLAFIHDINALSILKKLRVPVIIVVVNNKGGGIFHFLPISKSKDVFEKYFATPHDFSFEGVCKTFSVDYYNADNKKSFTDSYRLALKKGKSSVIEVETNRESNFKLRRKIKKEILQMLEETD